MEKLGRRILKVSIPAILGFMGLIIFEIVDVFWIGKIGSKAIAAVGAASFIIWTIYALQNLTHIGCATLMSQCYGAGKIKEAHRVAAETFWLSIIFILIMMGVLFLSYEKIFFLMGLDEETLNFAGQYFSVWLCGLPVIYLFSLQGQIFSAYSDTVNMMVTLAISLLINIVLDPILMFGYLGCPALGIKGAALATIVSSVIGLLIRHRIMRDKNCIGRWRSYFVVPQIYLRRILSIGLPTAVNSASWTLTYPFLSTIITKFGMLPLAALNLGHRIEGVPYFIGMGFQISLASIIGQLYGQGKKSDIQATMIMGLKIITLILLPVSLIFVLIPEQLISLVNSDPEVVEYAAEYLRIIGIFEIFMGWELLIEGAFNGIGNTRVYMRIVTPITISRIPLSYFFAITMNLGVSGIWWVISCTTFLKGTLLFWAFNYCKSNRKKGIVPAYDLCLR